MKNNLLYTMNENHQIVEDNILDPAGQIIFSGRNDGDYKNKYFLYNYDIRNSVTNIINPEGKLIKGYSYDEFGDTAERGDKTFKNSVKFTGAVSDDSTGLYYMNSRFYNPSTARFLTQDTYTGTPYEPWTQHLYTYCSNDPVDMVDPTGHIPTHPVAMSDGNAIYYPSLSQSSEQRKKQYLSDAIPFIPGINIVNNAKIAITGLDLMNYAYNSNEMQDAQLFMYLDIAAPVIGLECSELNGAGINELKNIDQDALKWLNKGPADNLVYYGIQDGEPVYTGITKQAIKRRLSQHNINGKNFEALNKVVGGLKRNQARAIEQYFIENGPNALNKINSISKNFKFYKDAIKFAEEYLKHI